MAIARWSLRSKTPWIARSSHCLSTTPSGLVIVYGGELKPRTPVDADDNIEQGGHVKGSVHVFDLNAHQKNRDTLQGWRTSPPLTTATKVAGASAANVPVARVGATTVFHDGCLYLWGGRGGVDMTPLKGAQSGVWRSRLDHTGVQRTDNSWDLICTGNEVGAPEPRSYHTAIAHYGKMYIHAGCPTSGRLGTLHSFDLTGHTWKSLASAPEPARGGTSLVAASLADIGPILLRYGGFSGYELPASAGSLDIYLIRDDRWCTVQPSPDPVYGNPSARSVHGFLPFQSPAPSLTDAVAVLFHGERDASSLGHAGAGTFWDDVWLLTRNEAHALAEGWAWKKVEVPGAGTEEAVRPEGRGWFASAVWEDDSGNSRVVMHGGLLSSNERSDELWELQIE
ncbi:hypothetical protein AcV7_001151 [Taiwanofungus camphoratus]|nr:hypothetical protein AcV7_001151 [Antrodia cinnamomea]